MAFECLLQLGGIIVAWINDVRYNRNGQLLIPKRKKLHDSAPKDTPLIDTSDDALGQNLSSVKCGQPLEEDQMIDNICRSDTCDMRLPSNGRDESSSPISFDSSTLHNEVALSLGAKPSGLSSSNTSKEVEPAPSALRKQLLDAQIESPLGSLKFFIPDNEWRRLVTPDSISIELRRGRETRTNAEFEGCAQKILKEAPRLFAALVCRQLSDSIHGFLKEQIDDTDLPFIRCDEIGGHIKFCSRKFPGRPVNCMRGWEREAIIDFVRLQRSLFSPIFSFSDDIEHQELDDNDVLPFVENHQRSAINRPAQGGFGSVWKAKIHPAHQKINCCVDTENQYPFIAVKQLHYNNQECFDAEVKMLKTFRKRGTTHLVKLLATFRYEGNYYLLFPWADANLRQYWENNPTPQFSIDTVLWFVRQCKAITSGLHLVHNYKLTEESMDRTSSSLSGSSRAYEPRQDDEKKQYGRHGDIKPENFLWFRDENLPGKDQGVLVIADFGLTDFHRRATRSAIPVVNGSATYEPPEVKISTTVSREYDIWSLGCTFLEFVTWLACGWAILDHFPEARTIPTDEHMIDDNFYTIRSDPSGKAVTATVRQGVIEWMQDMQGLPRSSPFVLEFLDMISKHMLVVNPKNRIKARELNRKLTIMLRKAEHAAQHDPGYLVGASHSQFCDRLWLDDQAPYSLRSHINRAPSRSDGDPLPIAHRVASATQAMRPLSPEMSTGFFTELSMNLPTARQRIND